MVIAYPWAPLRMAINQPRTLMQMRMRDCSILAVSRASKTQLTVWTRTQIQRSLVSLTLGPVSASFIALSGVWWCSLLLFASEVDDVTADSGAVQGQCPEDIICRIGHKLSRTATSPPGTLRPPHLSSPAAKSQVNPQSSGPKIPLVSGQL
ncbi:hypothetical protein B0H16DRAFT_179074 [Mycena metata]|uniref:Uncharacterized protein n=1 Tax=Mycena metata TaxID=1033252 RepID=A0AAD7I0A5_9AGAR|nr:hypothetical protein B0H16DRAFT_179074 [Mycena metata]